MIATFYSYKGGVGRSMALANVAYWLALEGARVLMIDWDLEAPGLENYFFDQERLKTFRKKPGLMDLLAAYKKAYTEELAAGLRMAAEADAAAARENAPDVEGAPASGAAIALDGAERQQAAEAACAKLKLVEHYIEAIPVPGSGSLGLISPGSRTDDAPAAQVVQSRESELGRPLTADEYLEVRRKQRKSAAGMPTRTFAQYAEDVQNFDWDEFLRAYNGEAFFSWVRRTSLPEYDDGGNELSPGLADILLIDSRTGITEMGGVCSRLLADVVVTFCATNDQNLDGALRMARSFRRPEILERRQQKPEVMLIPSRVEGTNEQGELEKFQARFRKTEREFPTRIFRFAPPSRDGQRFEECEYVPGAGSPSYWDLYVPYYPLLSYTEALVFPGATGARVVAIDKMQEKYRRLSAYIVLHAPERSRLRAKLAPVLRKETPNLLDLAVLVYWPDAEKTVGDIHERLEAAGVLLYPDQVHLSGSPAEVAGVLAVIRQARAAVFVLSRDAERSEAIRKEIRWARQNGRPVFILCSGELQAEWSGFSDRFEIERDWDRFLSALRGPAVTLPAANMTPPLPDEYLPRPEEEAKLRDALLDAARHPGLSQVALYGRDGFGKTCLAAAACQDERIQDAFPDGIIWITAGPEPNVAGELTNAYIALHGEPPEDTGETLLRTKLQARLSGRRFLMVIDDVRDPDMLKRLPSPVAECVWLMITRDHRLVVDIRRSIELLPPDKSTAIRVLTANVAPESDETHDWAGLAALLQNSPILLKTVNRALREAPHTPAPDVVFGMANTLRASGVRLADVTIVSAEGVESNVHAVADRLRRWWVRVTDDSRNVLVIDDGGARRSPRVQGAMREARQAGKRVFHILTEDDRWWETLVPFLRQEEVVYRAPVMVRPRDGCFIDRPTEAEQLRVRLLDAANAPGATTIRLTGPPGSGKTTLISHVLQRDEIVDAYPAGILLADGAQLSTSFHRILESLTGCPQPPLPEPEAKAKLEKVLAAGGFLLVVEEPPAGVEAARLPWVRWPHTLLIISASDADADGPEPLHIRVGPMKTPEAVQLLRSQSPDLRGSDEQWSEIAQRLHCWPYVLSLAATNVRDYESARTMVRRHGVLAFEANACPAAGVGDLMRRILTEADFAVFAAHPDLAGAPERDRDRFTRSGLLTAAEDGSVQVWPVLADYLEAEGALPPRRRVAYPRRSVLSAADRKTNPDVAAAEDALRTGKVTGSPKEIKALAGRLKAARYFGLARKFIARTRQDRVLSADPKLKQWLPQQHALCTYKDEGLPLDARLQRALKILDSADPLNQTKDQETLGIAGAIHKAMWLRDGQSRHLEESLSYYRRGYDIGIETGFTLDYGYTAINAAYVLDLLAAEARADGATADARRELARSIRKRLTEVLPGLLDDPDTAWLGSEWWFAATLVEAHFGLALEAGTPEQAACDYGRARHWIREALAQNFSDWEYQSTVRQLLDLARLHGVSAEGPSSPAFRAIRLLLRDETAALDNIRRGKVGLALSGGGFRASLFHIGVLARLAEFDMLRHVEVLSCVSGGSIIGAHYYLEVRNHLRNHAELTREDAIAIVKRIAENFLAGVQCDLRNRLFSSLGGALKLAFQRRYSQTAVLGEMFEHYLYASVPDGEGGRDKPRWLNDLKICPKDGPDDFIPKLDNWRRSTKVPVLILNATTLNTGHNWQFTATWMGESPAFINSEIDANERLRRIYYDEAPEPYKRMRLGHAVAASAAVPLLFDPLELPGLYEDRDPGTDSPLPTGQASRQPGRTSPRVVRLSDGGVHDNQGIGGLLEQECTVLLVSDASGQTRTIDDPPNGHLDVLWRANDLLQERVRWAQYSDMDAREHGGILRGLMFVHLRKDLDVNPVRWKGNNEPPEPPDEPEEVAAREASTRTSYNVLKRAQRLLASIRTDLDAFSDEEAYALMLSGYRMVSHELPGCVNGFNLDPKTEKKWCFHDAAPLLDDPNAVPKVLHVSGDVFGKAGTLWPGLKRTLMATVVLALGGILWLLLLLFEPAGIGLAIGAVGALAIAAIVVVGGSLLLRRLLARLGARKSYSQLAIGLISASAGWLIARLHVKFVRPWYLAKGKLSGDEVELRTSRRRLAYSARALAAIVLIGLVLLGVSAKSIRVNAAIWTGDLRLLTGSPASAERAYNAAIRRGANVYDRRAKARMHLLDFRGAIDDFQAALRLRPDSADLWSRLGYARRLAADLWGALRAYRVAEHLSPDASVEQNVQFLSALLPASDSITTVPAKLYIQVANERVSEQLRNFVYKLSSADIVVPGVQVTGVSPPKTELRYAPADASEAQDIAGLLLSFGIPTKLVTTDSTGTRRTRQFVLAFGKDMALLQ